LEREDQKSWLELQTEKVEVARLRSEADRQRVHSSPRTKLLSRVPGNNEGNDGDKQVVVVGGQRKLAVKVQGEWFASDLLPVMEQTSDIESKAPPASQVINISSSELDEHAYKNELDSNATEHLVDDDDLVIGIEANSIYEIEVFLVISADPTEDFSFKFDLPDGSEIRWTSDLDGEPGTVRDDTRIHIAT